MRIRNILVFALSVAAAGGTLAVAQEGLSIPKVLQITREYTKPYKNGMAHDKTESAFVAAMTKAKLPYYYIGLNSLTGKARSLYLAGYSSFEDWEKANKLVEKNPTLMAELEHDSTADGELLESVDSAVFIYDEQDSYKAEANLSGSRYMEATVFHVRSGHVADWRKAGKLVKDAYDKAGISSVHWAMFEVAYGAPDRTYLALSDDKSLADIDTAYAGDKKFMDALGEDGVKELRELMASAVQSSQSELFSINPKQSYVPEEWIKAAPEFWKPKPAATKPMAEEKKP
jgi:hypothetical protein